MASKSKNKKKASHKKAIRKPRQSRLPGMEDAQIEELEAAAESYVEVRNQRMALTPVEVERKGELLGLMKHHGKEKYVHGKFEIKVVAKDETVRVKVNKEDSGDE